MIKEAIFNINKPQNMTSQDVVAIVRKTLKFKKVGHTGTLDPMATGVLPICVGKSTRIIEYMDLDIKKYKCSMIFGIETDTQDVWGNVIRECDTGNLTEENIREAFSHFRGIINQKPPMYSAIKVNGKRLYEYAREGKTVDVKTRQVYIKSIDIENIDISNSKEKSVVFSVECSKGTYIRTICQDVGQQLGCGGTLSGLERTKSGIFDINNAIPLKAFSEMSSEERESKIIKSYEPLENFGKCTVDRNTALLFANGRHIPCEKGKIICKPKYETEDFYIPIREEYRRAYNIFANMDGTEKFMGIAFYDKRHEEFIADKVMFTKEEI